MTDAPRPIELNIVTKLHDPNYRQEFFLAESSRLIAKQLIELRRRRGLTQTELAALADTGQPAISRVERADYHGWSFRMLRKLAQKLDARLRVYIEAAEDVISEYSEGEITGLLDASASAEKADTQSQVLADQQTAIRRPAAKTSNVVTPQQLGGLGYIERRVEQGLWN